MNKFLFVLFATLLSGIAIVLTLPAEAETVSGLDISSNPISYTGADAITAISSVTDYDRLYIADRSGLIQVYDHSADDIVNNNFLDLDESSISFDYGSEKGLLGFVLHPDYRSNGFAYVAYTDNQTPFNLVISRFIADGDPDGEEVILLDNSEFVIRKISQPFSNHNGGDLQFGPDGYLYVAIGDGGSQNDPGNRAQNKENFYGSILRLDVDNIGVDIIPEDNPNKYAPGFPAVWDYGLRNPWRISFDSVTGNMFIADVGGGMREEINFENLKEGGDKNYGWRCREGDIANPNVSNCTLTSTATNPIATYDHSGGKCSVTGGHVYRGSSYPALYGKYIYTDFCTGDTYTLQRALNHSGGWEMTHQGDLIDGENVTTYGVGYDDELFVGTSAGTVYQVVANAPAALPSVTNDSAISGITTEWNYYPFGTTFSHKPVVTASVHTEAGGDEVFLQIRNVTTDGFEARIRENTHAGFDNGHLIEAFTWHAVLEDFAHETEEMYTGAVNVGSTWLTVAFPVPFSSAANAHVLANLQTANGSDIAYAEIRNVTATGFDVRVEEPPGYDDEHITETVGFVAWDTDAPFNEGGKASLTHEWSTVNFVGSYDSYTGVIANVVTNNGFEPVTVDIRNVTGDSFEARLEESPLRDGTHTTEEIVWYVETPVPGTFQSNFSTVDHRWKQIPFRHTHTLVPDILAEINSENGGDTAAVDLRKIGVNGFEARIEEDRVAGWDGVHTTETVAWSSFYDGNLVRTSLGPTPTTLAVPTPYPSPQYVFGQIQSENGIDTVALEIGSISGSSFSARLEEDEGAGWDGYHLDETASFMVFNAPPWGVAGSVVLNNNSNWQTIDTTSGGFLNTPIVYATVATQNGTHTVSPDIRNVTTTSFQIRIEEEPLRYDGSHVDEEVYWWAFDPFGL